MLCYGHFTEFQIQFLILIIHQKIDKMIDKKFKKGDRVSVLDENITGIVKKVKDGLISILTEDDFVLDFSINELIKGNVQPR